MASYPPPLNHLRRKPRVVNVEYADTAATTGETYPVSTDPLYSHPLVAKRYGIRKDITALSNMGPRVPRMRKRP